MRMPNLPTKPGVRPLALLLATLFVAAAAAGCLGSDEQDDEKNGETDPFDRGFEPRSTHSSLDIVLAAPMNTWAGENVTLDGTGSSAMDAQIVSWTFELGDGTVIDLSSEQEPLIEHNYTAGGAYQVNLTAEAHFVDDGNKNRSDEPDGNESAFGDSRDDDNETIRETTSRIVVVHDRFPVEETELEAGLSSGDTAEHAFTTQDGASNLTVNLTVESTDFLMDAEGTLRILDPEGAAVLEEPFSIGSDDEETFALEGSLNATGDHTLEVVLDEGAITYEGTIEVIYKSEADASAE